MKSKNIVIVGGGTAGWLTALFAKKTYPEHEVSLIESKQIGILGAGEGTTPFFHTILDSIDISYADIIKNCKASFKTSLKYTNWSFKNKEYYHTFENTSSKLQNHRASKDNNFFIECYRNGMLPVQETLVSMCCKSNTLPLIQQTNNLNDTQYFAPMALHFDASLLAQYLKSVGIKRGINHIEGKVADIKIDEQGYTTSLTLDGGSQVPVTFVFDCTGFRRAIIQKKYKSKWKSLQKMLPAKKALAFFLEPTESLPPYTDVIAGDCGWFWKIPLQHRYGCGYVYDTDFLSESEAKEEIDKLTGQNAQIRNTFDIVPGYLEEIWIKNCIGLGLSSGFLEPLEATSIHQLGRNLMDFFAIENAIYERDQYIIDEYNQYYAQETTHIAEFLYLHYITNKKDTKFWSDFTTNNKMPQNIQEILSIAKRRLLNARDIKHDMIFHLDNYLSILSGNDVFTQQAIKNSYSRTKEQTQLLLNQLFDEHELAKMFADHKWFVNFLCEQS